MKKSLFTMMAAALLASSAMAQVLIYDYSASIKLVTAPKTVSVTCDDENCSANGKVTLDSPKLTNGKISGYMVMEACDSCGGDMFESDPYDGPNDVLFYLTSNLNNNKKAVYRAEGEFQAIMFGAKAGESSQGKHAGDYIGMKKFTDAGAYFSFYIALERDSKYYSWLSKYTYDPVGIDEDGEQFTYQSAFENAGYGKVVRKSTEVECGGEETCWTIKNLSGSLVSLCYGVGHCSKYIFDICEVETRELTPISGTYTLKLNDKLTYKQKEGQPIDFAEAEEIVLAKMGAKKDKNGVYVVYTDADDDADEEFDVIEGTPWVPVED